MPSTPNPIDSRPILLSEQEIAERIDALATEIAPHIDDETVCVCLLTGGIWFSADLMRALARKGVHPLFDALWLTSYGHGRESQGNVILRTSLQYEVTGRKVLIMDDVFDSGRSLVAANAIVRENGATDVLIAVFAAKPYPGERALNPDFVAWKDAPLKFLLGYGMDEAGRFRGLPDVREG
jgi:hypoxanthine phosphoribosyltransferase